MPFVIDQQNCSCCHQCRVECPVQAIRFRDSKYWIDPDKCINCGTCVNVCHNECISDPENPPLAPAFHEKEFKSCDICIIGAGAAGMTAAAKAADQGLKVIVLEKGHEVGGSAWYAAGFRVHYSKWHGAAGLKDNREKLYEQFMKKTEGKVDGKLLRRMFEANTEFVDWLITDHELGKSYELAPGPMGMMFRGTFEWERAEKRIDKMIGPGEGGWFMCTMLRDSFLEKGGEILYTTAGKKLLTDDNGAVTGVLADDLGGELEISCKSVVVASGAFTRNKKIMDQMQPLFYETGKEPIHIFTYSHCTGDGITMCEEIGADIDYINRRVNMFGPMRHPYPCVSMNMALSGSGVKFDSQGKLFRQEMRMKEVSELVFDPKRYCWIVIDESIAESAISRALEEPPQSPGMDLGKFLACWRDVLQEEEAAGSIVSAPTLEALAEKLGFDPVYVVKTIQEENLMLNDPPAPPTNPPAKDGDDDDADELPPMMLWAEPQPVEKGPFYALRLKLFHENAIGGMTIDENSSVLRDGKPIPGLYAAGDTTRGIMIPGDIGVEYIESVFTALTQAFNEGYIAGVEAAKFAKP